MMDWLWILLALNYIVAGMGTVILQIHRYPELATPRCWTFIPVCFLCWPAIYLLAILNFRVME